MVARGLLWVRRFADAGVIELLTQGQAYDRFQRAEGLQRPSRREMKGPTPGLYTMFTTNTHDWVNAQDSIDTLNRVIDIHEANEVPVDVYQTGPMVQL